VPRGACACRPGYKATGHTKGDSGLQWRLPVLGHEHRVWVAEGVQCDTLCDVSSGVNSCQEVSLIGKPCVGLEHNTSYQPAVDPPGGYGNYSHTLSSSSGETAIESLDDPAGSTGATSEDLDFDDSDFSVEGNFLDLKDDSLDAATTSNMHDVSNDEPTASTDDLDDVSLASQIQPLNQATAVASTDFADAEASESDENLSASETLISSSDD
jgi:hypothetical protein